MKVKNLVPGKYYYCKWGLDELGGVVKYLKYIYQDSNGMLAVEKQKGVTYLVYPEDLSEDLSDIVTITLENYKEGK